MKNEEEITPMEDTMENAVNKLKELGYLVEHMPTQSITWSEECVWQTLSKEQEDFIKSIRIIPYNGKVLKGYKVVNVDTFMKKAHETILGKPNLSTPTKNK